jgi:hypothetical protein
MRQIFTWLKVRSETFRLLPDYGKAMAKAWINILFGETVVSAVFLVWWAVTNPKNPPLIFAFVIAMFVAGYFVWRADHIRLTPKLGISCERHLQETPVEQGKERRVFVQIEPTCLSEAPVIECQGHLLRVYNRWADEEWSLTEMRERLLLDWSHYGTDPITLYPSGGQYLNVCWRQNNIQTLIPCCTPVPSRWREAFDNVGTYKFDIELTAKDCPPVQVSVTVNIDKTEWNQPNVTVTPAWNET